MNFTTHKTQASYNVQNTHNLTMHEKCMHLRTHETLHEAYNTQKKKQSYILQYVTHNIYIYTIMNHAQNKLD